MHYSYLFIHVAKMIRQLLNVCFIVVINNNIIFSFANSQPLMKEKTMLCMGARRLLSFFFS